ncbi:MAG TPA: selenocysteine-specific translation elongation factor, partial [Negativicutes bacterium]|nr:selenocysteine-specific translation elongation factor [Negativicutes bacterium]
MKHLIVGTAGHVDHGKTALIRYLTGTDTDRLVEEKKRGISIDIGFAALCFEKSLTLGIIDVPGHERFLKNMLAGTGGMDMVMLVIAADEGIMPQTREHFEMLQCLGIKRGLVVLSKIDKVDQEWLSLVEEDVKSYLAGTFLMDAPVCKVSTITGEGMTELKAALRLQAETMNERDRNAPFRLWIDRAFNLKGQGLIVTGSVLTGTLKTGEAVSVFPAGIAGKVREIETHNQSALIVGAGQRASINLAGIALSEVGRGMFLSADGYGQTGEIWEAAILWKKYFPSGTRIRFHIGTGEFIGRMSFTKNDTKASLIRLHLEKPISAGLGDRGILRRYSPQDLIGGVTLLCPAEHNNKRNEQLVRLNEAFRHQAQAAIMFELLLMTKEPPTLHQWIRLAGYFNTPQTYDAINCLINCGKVKQIGNYFVADEQLIAFQLQMKKVLEEYHKQKPDEPGISRETLRRKIKLPENIADWFLKDAILRGFAQIQDEFVAVP